MPAHGVYCAVHAASTATGSDVSGVEELAQLADQLPVHVAHVNSYCRGQIEDPVAEASRALTALAGSTGCWSESYLSVLNVAAEARCSGGVPLSGVVRTCVLQTCLVWVRRDRRRCNPRPQRPRRLQGRVQGELAEGIGYLAPEPGLELVRSQKIYGIVIRN